MRTAYTSVFVAVLSILPAIPAFGDIVYTRDGRKFEGSVTKQGGKVTIKTKFGTVTIRQEDVERIERKATPAQQFETKLAALKLQDRSVKRGQKNYDVRMETIAQKYHDLGVWADKKRLKREAKACFRRVVEIVPDHEEARKQLGQVKYKGQWVPEDVKMRAEGLVKFRGRWVTPEEAESHRRASRSTASRPPPVLIKRPSASEFTVPCPACRGARAQPLHCGQCRGTGRIFNGLNICFKCNGKGQQFIRCAMCNGTGKKNQWR